MTDITDKIILVDFAGTLVNAEIIEEANEFRSAILNRGIPAKDEHGNPELLYKANREFVESLTGIKKGMKVHYRKNDLGFMDLTGEQVQNQIATNLFQIGMFMAAKKHGLGIFPEGLVQQLKRIKKLGYKLAIVSGVRTDIISGMLQISKAGLEFDYLYGQPPVLGEENQASAIKELKKRGSIAYSIGDKYSDLERTRLPGTKLIFVRWGHASGGEEELADYSIINPEELKEIIKEEK